MSRWRIRGLVARLVGRVRTGRPLRHGHAAVCAGGDELAVEATLLEVEVELAAGEFVERFGRGHRRSSLSCFSSWSTRAASDRISRSALNGSQVFVALPAGAAWPVVGLLPVAVLVELPADDVADLHGVAITEGLVVAHGCSLLLSMSSGVYGRMNSVIASRGTRTWPWRPSRTARSFAAGDVPADRDGMQAERGRGLLHMQQLAIACLHKFRILLALEDFERKTIVRSDRGPKSGVASRWTRSRFGRRRRTAWSAED